MSPGGGPETWISADALEESGQIDPPIDNQKTDAHDHGGNRHIPGPYDGDYDQQGQQGRPPWFLASLEKILPYKIEKFRENPVFHQRLCGRWSCKKIGKGGRRGGNQNSYENKNRDQRDLRKHNDRGNGHRMTRPRLVIQQLGSNEAEDYGDAQVNKQGDTDGKKGSHRKRPPGIFEVAAHTDTGIDAGYSREEGSKRDPKSEHPGRTVPVRPIHKH